MVMLKSAIYCNVFILLIMSIFFLTRIFMKNSDLKKLRKVIIIYIIFNFISFYLCGSEIVDIGWDFIFLFPISIISFIIHIVSICCINRKIKKSNNTDYNILSIKKYIILSIIPVIVFIIPYVYELYVINNCNYLLKYNYQTGIIQSDDTYIAIINNKPVTITLQKNLFNRKGFSAKKLNYNIIYTNGVEISTRDSSYNKIISKYCKYFISVINIFKINNYSRIRVTDINNPVITIKFVLVCLVYILFKELEHTRFITRFDIYLFSHMYFLIYY